MKLDKLNIDNIRESANHSVCTDSDSSIGNVPANVDDTKVDSDTDTSTKSSTKSPVLDIVSRTESLVFTNV